MSDVRCISDVSNVSAMTYREHESRDTLVMCVVEYMSDVGY